MSPQEEIIEAKIREALARGEDANLPGKGKPIDLDGYFATPEHLRMAFSVLRSADVVPEELEILKEIHRLKSLEEASSDEAEKLRLRLKISDLHAVYDMKMQRYTKGGAL